MKLIFKYLKSYWLSVLMVIAMIFVQVQTELILPDYMSSIVTNGIQYGGITETVPVALSENTYHKLTLFADPSALAEAYQLYPAGTTARLKNNEVSFKEATYVLKEDSQLPSLADALLKLRILNDTAELNEEDLRLLLANEEQLSALNRAIDQKAKELATSQGDIVRELIRDEYATIGLTLQVVQTNFILKEGLYMLGFALISVIAQIIATYLAARIATTIATRMRHDIFAKVESFANAEFSRFSSSSLITRTTNDITQVQNIIQMLLRIVIMAPMMGLTSIYKVLRYPSMAWLLVVAVAVLMAIMLLILITTMPKFKLMQGLVDKMNNVMRELLDGMLVVRAFNGEKIEEQRFDEANHNYARVSLFLNRIMSCLMPISMLLMNVLTVGIIWYGSKEIDLNVMTVGDMMAFIQYAMHVVMSFMMVSMVWVMIPRSLVSAERIAEVLDTTNSVIDRKDARSLPENNAPIAFKHVYFKYPKAEEYVLEDISFTALPGETVAFIGSTGSGKSTLIKLIPRLFDVSSGSITYGDIDIRDLKQQELRQRIGFASQKAILFTGTIESNIRFGRDITDDALEQAVTVSQSRAIVDEKENGFKEAITQGGSNVSGGQKQRLSIARALAGNPDIYIFDDSFSALDYATDLKLRNELNELVKQRNATVFIVAQRISSIRNANKIIVLDEGHIVGNGTHEELLKNCSVYRDIARSQLSEEELNYAA